MGDPIPLSPQTTIIFSEFQQHLEKEQSLREDIRTLVQSLEQTSRGLLTLLQGIHQRENIHQVARICTQTEPGFSTVKTQIAELAKKIPTDMYYRFNDHWRYAMQRLVTLATLTMYLRENRLASQSEVAKMFGIGTKLEEGFFLDLEDYLFGVLSMTNELSRFATNSVTAGDYQRPIALASFLAELNAGFRLLNLKNDALRKRFDGLKYDIKKVEEIVYDLTIRGLRPEAT